MLPGMQIPMGALGGEPIPVLLLHMDGADASTTFSDASPSAHTVTVHGDAQIDTAESKFGGASGLFDGTGDYLTLDGSSDFAFGTGDFTIDFWIRPTSVAGAQVFYDARTAEPQQAIALYAAGGGVSLYVNGADRIDGSGPSSLTNDTWFHVALTRSGTSTKLFINGQQAGSTYTDSNDYVNGSGRPVIGAQENGGGQYLNGRLDEFRVLKGTAAWTSNFTPPSAPYS